MGQVQNSLIVGIGVDGGHQPSYDAEFLVDDLGKGSQAVGGAGRVGQDVVRFGIILVFVDAHDDGDIFIRSRSGNDDLFCTGFDMLLGVRLFGEEPR
jgi:hypothetical protein